MRFSAAEIEAAASRLIKRLSIAWDTRLLVEFEAGLHPELLSHERVASMAQSLPVLTRHLMGAMTFVHQPVTYYDIYRVCRSVVLIYRLDAALTVLDEKNVENLNSRLARLIHEMEHEKFDSVLLELLTAAQYAKLPEAERITFIAEHPSRKTPDLLVVRSGRRMLIECKRSDRIRGHQMDLRNIVRSLLGPICLEFRAAGVCLNAEVTFHVDPKTVGPKGLAGALHDSLVNGVPIVSRDYTVKAESIVPFGSEHGPTLYPSPFFTWARYQYSVRSEWFGLVSQAVVQNGHWAWTPEHIRHGHSSWIVDCSWDAGIKWRVDQPDIVERYRRFAFNTVFKGLGQLQAQAAETGLHLWLESDHFLLGRRGTLVDLFTRLKESQRDQFSWVIVNETLFDISPQGYFDLIEHAHQIKGPTATVPNSPVSNLFTEQDEEGGLGEFGTGANLPDIDAVS